MALLSCNRPVPWRICIPLLMASTVSNVSSQAFPSSQPPFCTTVPGAGTPSFPNCVGPVSHLVQGRGVCGNADRPDNLFPPWANLTLAQQGQQFAFSHLASVSFSAVYGLLSSLFPDAVDVLIFSRNSGTVDDAAKRYMATVTQMVVWYQDFLNSPLSENGTDMLASLANVRKLHISKAALATNQLNQYSYLVNDTVFAGYNLKTALSGPFFDDLQNSNIPQSLRAPPPSHWTNVTSVVMNQNIQTITQFAFGGLVLLFPNEIGINATDDEVWAFVHLWAVIGYAIGVEDEYNVFLQPNIQTTRVYFLQFFQTYHIPSLFNVNFRTKVMMENVLFGLWKICGLQWNYLFTPNIILYKLLNSFVQIPANATYLTMTPPEMEGNSILDTVGLPGIANNQNYRNNADNTTWYTLFQSGLYFFQNDYFTQSSRATNVFYDDPNMYYP